MTTLAEPPAAVQDAAPTRTTTLPDVTAAAVLGDVHAWVDAVAELTSPDPVVWCDGSDEERRALLAQMERTGTLLALDPTLRPGSYLARSDPSHQTTAAGSVSSATASTHACTSPSTAAVTSGSEVVRVGAASCTAAGGSASVVIVDLLLVGRGRPVLSIDPSCRQAARASRAISMSSSALLDLESRCDRSGQ